MSLVDFVDVKNSRSIFRAARAEYVGKCSVVDQRPHHAAESRHTLLRHAGSACTTMFLPSRQLLRNIKVLYLLFTIREGLTISPTILETWRKRSRRFM